MPKPEYTQQQREDDQRLVNMRLHFERSGVLTSAYYRLMPQFVEAECRLKDNAENNE